MPSLATIVPPLGPRLRRWLLPWLLAVAALANLAYPMYVHYDFSHSLDSRSYLRLASGRFDSVNVTRRYRVLVPGVVDTTTNFVEHPALVAQRLERFTTIVGRDRVIAGSDSGFGTFAGYGAVDPEIAWAKLATLKDGARRAS